MKKILILIFGISLCCQACTSSRSEKPKNLLSKNEMAELITEIRVTEVQLYNEHTKHYNEDSIRLHSQIAYAPIFAKYKISYKDYEDNINYYVSQPDKLEDILEQVTKNLEKLRDNK